MVCQNWIGLKLLLTKSVTNKKLYVKFSEKDFHTVVGDSGGLDQALYKTTVRYHSGGLDQALHKTSIRYLFKTLIKEESNTF